jgi:predicted RNA binding protein YcfA (HicA-like mRNA interferase family)
MSRREKLLEKMRRAPGSIRIGEVDALLRYEGFVLFNKRGSHRTYHHDDGRLITIVVPHGRRKTCSSSDVKKLLKVLDK